MAKKLACGRGQLSFKMACADIARTVQVRIGGPHLSKFKQLYDAKLNNAQELDANRFSYSVVIDRDDFASVTIHLLSTGNFCVLPLKPPRSLYAS